jgi:hypothetical protein
MTEAEIAREFDAATLARFAEEDGKMPEPQLQSLGESVEPKPASQAADMGFYWIVDGAHRSDVKRDAGSLP